MIDGKTLDTDGARDKQLEAWRQFAVGNRVRITGRYRRGEIGTVAERLDNRWDGLARYGVHLDLNEGFHGPTLTTDVCRYELTRHKPKKRPRP